MSRAPPKVTVTLDKADELQQTVARQQAEIAELKAHIVGQEQLIDELMEVSLKETDTYVHEARVKHATKAKTPSLAQ